MEFIKYIVEKGLWIIVWIINVFVIIGSIYNIIQLSIIELISVALIVLIILIGIYISYLIKKSEETKVEQW